MFFFKQTTAYEMATGLEFRRVPFRSLGTMAGLEPGRALPLVGALAVWIAFASAAQDGAIADRKSPEGGRRATRQARARSGGKNDDGKLGRAAGRERRCGQGCPGATSL